MDPLPRKHTKWEPSWDFTQNQASTCRRHLLKFPPEELDKHYVKLIQIDSRLKQLSQVPFPTLTNPYFPSINQINLSNGYAVHESAIATSAPLLTNPIQSLTSDVALSPLHEVIYKQRLEDLCHPFSSQIVNNYDVHGPMPTTHQFRNPIQLPTTDVVLPAQHNVINSQKLEDSSLPIVTERVNGYVHRPFACTLAPMLTTHQVWNQRQLSSPVLNVAPSPLSEAINSHALEDSSLPVANQVVNVFETFCESIDSVSEANHEEPQRAWTLEDLCKFYPDLVSNSETESHERHITGLPREDDPAQNINTNTLVDSKQECADRAVL
ncbi:hypothetical protein L6164_007650 [Bauhinia variegata]|uniref:Uncharacterized protein n=1 Tax=Bauhinia variegata TaxID=167791 RepID=A0ACB9PDA6_BAUVA|nr:hypothetical protein L6164_007650 [Bauhinia variegata]